MFTLTFSPGVILSSNEGWLGDLVTSWPRLTSSYVLTQHPGPGQARCGGNVTVCWHILHLIWHLTWHHDTVTLLPLSISLALTSCCLLRHWPSTGSGKRLRVGAGAESLQRLQGRSRRQPPSTMSSNVRFYISFYIYSPLFMTTNPSDERLNWNVNLDFLCQLISPSCTFRYWLDHEIIERESPDWVWTLGV